MTKLRDLTGFKVGYITVLYLLPQRTTKGKTQWKCHCSCGIDFISAGDNLVQNRLWTCGQCKWHIKHKAAYRSWHLMKQRCNNKQDVYYGSIGITYDPRWEYFQEFYLDMGDPPLDLWGRRKSLDRFPDNKGNYTKSNCRWADDFEQRRNQRSKTGVEIEKLPQLDLAPFFLPPSPPIKVQ